MLYHISFPIAVKTLSSVAKCQECEESLEQLVGFHIHLVPESCKSI